MVCALARWFLFRLHESPRYLVTHGREQEAVVALRSIATYNAHTIDITPADVLMPHASPSQSMSQRSLARDKKNSELPSPSHEADELSPVGSAVGLPRYRETDDNASSGPSSRTLYDSVGLGPAPPPRKSPIRLGSAFYSASHAGSPLDTTTNAFERSFADAAIRSGQSVDEEAGEGAPDEAEADVEGALLPEKSTVGQRAGREARKVGRWARKPTEWWRSWMTQMAKLFVPKWRRTVILMWIIWGSMSFCKSLSPDTDVADHD